jgi:glycine cleavage system H protein
MSQFKVDSAARYAKSHEWVRIEGDEAVVGISDPAQDMLSDIVYIELPAVGKELKAGERAAVVESVKAAEDVLAPLSGVVTAVNDALATSPEVVNGDPYGSWFFKMTPSAADAELGDLMDAAAYDEFAASAAH